MKEGYAAQSLREARSGERDNGAGGIWATARLLMIPSCVPESRAPRFPLKASFGAAHGPNSFKPWNA